MSRWLIVLVACAKPAPSAPAASAPTLFTIREESLGPLTAKTPATLAELRKTFAGYDVVAVNNESLEYRVTLDGARILDVIPDETGGVLNVHVLTPRADVAGRAWRVGKPLADLDHVTECECWADQTVCFTPGEHVAIGLAKICREGAFESAAARKALVGVPIRVAIWSPRPLVAGGYGVQLEERADGEPDPP